MLNQLARSWLERRGFTVLPPTFTGIVLAACSASGTRSRLDVIRNNPNAPIIAINGSTVDLSRDD